MHIKVWNGMGQCIGFLKSINHSRGVISVTQNVRYAKSYSNYNCIFDDIDYCKRYKPECNYTYE